MNIQNNYVPYLYICMYVVRTYHRTAGKRIKYTVIWTPWLKHDVQSISIIFTIITNSNKVDLFLKQVMTDDEKWITYDIQK